MCVIGKVLQRVDVAATGKILSFMESCFYLLITVARLLIFLETHHK